MSAGSLCGLTVLLSSQDACLRAHVTHCIRDNGERELDLAVYMIVREFLHENLTPELLRASEVVRQMWLFIPNGCSSSYCSHVTPLPGTPPNVSQLEMTNTNPYYGTPPSDPSKHAEAATLLANTVS